MLVILEQSNCSSVPSRVCLGVCPHLAITKNMRRCNKTAYVTANTLARLQMKLLVFDNSGGIRFQGHNLMGYAKS